MATIKIKNSNGAILFSYNCKNNNLKLTLEEAVKQNVDLSYAELSYADLEHANLAYAKLDNANLYGAKLSYAKLLGASLIGADMRSVTMRHTNISTAKLNKASLANATIAQTLLTQSIFTDAYLVDARINFGDAAGAVFNKANLTGTKFVRTDLSVTWFTDAKCIGTGFTECIMTNCSLIGADINRANFSGSVLSGCRGIIWASCGFSGHGEQGRMLTAVSINGNARLFCGCFSGNADDLADYIANGDQKCRESRTLAMQAVLSMLAYSNANDKTLPKYTSIAEFSDDMSSRSQTPLGKMLTEYQFRAAGCPERVLDELSKSE